MSAVAAQLRERLRARRDAIRVMDHTVQLSNERVWWSPSARWWSLFGSYPGDSRVTRDVPSRKVTLRESLEALTLLDALAQIDFQAFLDEVDALKAIGCYPPMDPRPAPHDVALGVVFTARSAKDLEPLAGCMYGDENQPSQAFQDDVAWLQKEMEGPSGFRIRPISVQLWTDSPDDLTATLRRILHDVTEQQRQLATVSERGHSLESGAMFMIREVTMDSSPVHVDALPLLGELQDRGVHIPILPKLEGNDASSQARHALAKSLRRLLLSPAPAQGSAPSIERVCLDSSIPEHLLAPLLSAIQASHTVRIIELSSEQEEANYEGEEDEDDEEYERREQRREDERRALNRLARWTAYALFSSHARHKVERLLVRELFVTDGVVRTLRSVLSAPNPLASVFKNVTGSERWISASKFYFDFPYERQTGNGNGVVLIVEQSLAARVVATHRYAGALFWKVLLPGGGLVWVRAKDATEIDTVAADPIGPLEIEFAHLCDWNLNIALGIMRLVPRVVRGIEIEAVNVLSENFDPGDESSNLTPFVREVLRKCPNLERLKLPTYTIIDRLGVFVEAASTSNFHLRRLHLDCWLDGDDADIIGFFDVLSDMTHPFTQHLEELHFQLESLKSEFVATWERMLQNNRRLHTISVAVSYGYTTGKDNELVVVRTGPLDIESKLAFLSVLQDPDRGTSARFLDASVVGSVFEYAAQHLVRVVRVKDE